MDSLLEVFLRLELGSGQEMSFTFLPPLAPHPAASLHRARSKWVCHPCPRPPSEGLQEPKPASPPHHCACVWAEVETLGLSFSVSYLSMKGFRMVIPNKKNIRTEKPIIVNPSSMARSSPALDGSFLCPSGGSPPLWSVFLFLPEVEMAVLWRKWGRDSSKEVGTFISPSWVLLPKGCEQVPCNTMRSYVQSLVKSLPKHAKMVCYKFFSWM